MACINVIGLSGGGYYVTSVQVKITVPPVASCVTPLRSITFDASLMCDGTNKTSSESREVHSTRCCYPLQEALVHVHVQMIVKNCYMYILNCMAFHILFSAACALIISCNNILIIISRIEINVP